MPSRDPFSLEAAPVIVGIEPGVPRLADTVDALVARVTDLERRLAEPAPPSSVEKLRPNPLFDPLGLSRDLVDLGSVPCAKLTLENAAQSIEFGYNQRVTFNQLKFDFGGLAGTSLGQFTCRRSGIYLIMARMYWEHKADYAADDVIITTIAINNTLMASSRYLLTAGDTDGPFEQEVFTTGALAVGTTVQLFVYQLSLSAKNIGFAAGGVVPPSLFMVLLGPGEGKKESGYGGIL